MTRAAARIVALLACLCFLPSGSAVAQTERLLGAEGANGNPGDLVILDPATGGVATTPPVAAEVSYVTPVRRWRSL